MTYTPLPLDEAKRLARVHGLTLTMPEARAYVFLDATGREIFDTHWREEADEAIEEWTVQEWRSTLRDLLADDILSPLDVLGELDGAERGVQFRVELDDVVQKLESMAAAFRAERARRE